MVDMAPVPARLRAAPLQIDAEKYLFPGSPDSCGGGAILDYREVAGHPIRAHIERIRLARFAGGGDSGFKERIVELGVVGEQSGGPEAGGRLRHLPRRCDVAIV